MKVNKQFIIDTEKLCFSFGKEKVLKNIDLKVEKGAIYGFLGPNGAGKTTTIRLLLGLLDGEGQQPILFGKSMGQNRMDILRKTGALIEQPALYEHLSGFENLKVTAAYRQIGIERVHEVLELVKLADQANKKVKAYSLGMKQRLGLALALMGKPELLILDEPVNGLDPKGIIETRELLIQLNKELGVTIFLSSHLLAEIEKMVTHIGIISKGNMVFQGTMDALKKLGNRDAVIRILTSDQRMAMTILTKTAQAFNVHNGFIEVGYIDQQQVGAIAKILVSGQCSIYHLEVVAEDLETTFINLTQN